MPSHLKGIAIFGMLWIYAGMAWANDPLKCGPISLVTENQWINLTANFSSSDITYTFAVSSGTSGCQGVGWRETMQKTYIAHTYHSLMEETARGNGEHLAALARLLGCPIKVHPQFFQVSHHHFDHLFQSPPDKIDHFLRTLKQQISKSPVLKAGCSTVSL